MTTTAIPSIETFYRDLTAWRDAGEPSTGPRAMRIAGGSDLNPLAKTGRLPRNLTSNPTPRRVRRRDPRTTDYRWDAERCCSVPLDPVTHQDLPPLTEETTMTETTTSTPAPTADRLAAALLDAQKTMQAVGKTSRNDHHDYTYASAEDIIAAARKVLHGAGLVARRGSWEIIDSAAGPAVRMQFTLAHGESGQSRTEAVDFPVCEQKGKPADKAVCTALTSAWSYWLRDLLLIPRTDAYVDGRDDRHHEPQARPYTHPRAQLIAALQERGLDHAAAMRVHGWFLRQCGGQPTPEDCRRFRADITAGIFDQGVPRDRQPAGEQQQPEARLDLGEVQQRLVTAMQARGIDRPDAVRLYAGWLKQHKRPSASAVEAFAAAIDNGDLDHAAQLDAAAA